MLLTDSHVHFDGFFEPDVRSEVVQRARDAGVAHMVAIGGSPAANERALAMAGDFPDAVCAVIGYDRDEAIRQPDMEQLADLLGDPRVAGVGEAGLDYHYSPESAPEQRALFQGMLELAVSHKLPVVVHSRAADDDTLDLLAGFIASRGGNPDVPGVLHCFTGSMALAERVLALGMMVSFSGIITFRNAEALRQVATMVPDDRLLIETDTPYLAPIPFRGAPNEPCRLVHVAGKLAEVRHCDVEHIAAITARNADRVFRRRNPAD